MTLSGCLAVFEYAYNLTQQMDPLNQGRGVLQFKSALKAVLAVHSVLFLVEVGLSVLHSIPTMSFNEISICSSHHIVLFCTKVFECAKG